jgi:hypothetical protein
MKIRKSIAIFSLSIAAVFLMAGMAQANELVSLLMSQLGVTQPQAEGGAGAIFKTAQENLTPDEFNKIETAVPEADSLIKAAPKVEEESTGGFGSLTSMAKKAAPGQLGSAAELSQSFDKLGLEKDMIGKFSNIVVDYCKEKGGAMVSSLMQKAIGF